MPTLGLDARRDPYLSFNFLVEIEGLVVGGFSEVGGLEIETVFEDYREGGRNDYVHRLPGPTRYPSNLILRRGITDIATLWSWHQDVAAGRIERRNGTVYLLDAQGQPSIWWNFREAYPVRWSGPSLRAESNAIAVETIELAHRGLSRPAVSRDVSSQGGTLSTFFNVFR